MEFILASQILVAMADGGRKELCTRMRVWELLEEYVIEPMDGTSSSMVAISRTDASMKLIGDSGVSYLPFCLLQV